MRNHIIQIAAFAARKIVGAIVTLWFLATVVFFLGRLTPGDEARAAAGASATPEQVEAIRRRLGLTGSLMEQYLAYLGRLAHGDLGVSSSSQGPVAGAIFAVLPHTAELVVTSMLIIVTVAIPLAVWSAVRASGAGDTLRRLVVIIAAGMPTFWAAILLQSLVAGQWRILPISGIATVGIQVPPVTGLRTIDSVLAGSPIAFWDAVDHLILPAVVLAIPFSGQLFRIVRAELLRVLAREHIEVVRATGVSGRHVIWDHAFPQIVNPVLLILGVDFAGMFGSAVLVESVFGRDGFGSFMTNAMAQKDTAAVLGGVLVIGIIVVVTSIVIDTIQIIRDPRVRAKQIGGAA